MRIAALFLIKVCGYMPRIREQQAVGPTQAHGEIIYGDTRWIEDDCPDTFLNLFFYFLLQLLCVMISHWMTVLKYKMLSQILIKNAGLVW